MEQGLPRGSHIQFVGLYETFLDVVFRQEDHVGRSSGRTLLVRATEAEIRRRGALRILDVAAGTGFPSLDLAAGGGDLTVHCCDGDRAMVAVLAGRAAQLGVPLERITPARRTTAAQPTGPGALVVDWQHLDRVAGHYDYVICRGNALAYAGTWSGGEHVATIKDHRDHLEYMADRVSPGGHLHIDGPWTLELPAETYRVLSAGSMSIWEQVSLEGDRRIWDVTFKEQHQDEGVTFRRYSSRLTIHDVAAALDELGFDETEPFQLEGERASYGTIIARRSLEGRSETELLGS